MMFTISLLLLSTLSSAVVRNCQENVVIAIDQTPENTVVEAYNLNGFYTFAEGPSLDQLVVVNRRPATPAQCDQFLQAFNIEPDRLRPNCLNDTQIGLNVCEGQRGLDDYDAPLTYAKICNTDAMFYLRIEGSVYRRVLTIYQNVNEFQATPEAQVALVPDAARILLAKTTCRSNSTSPATSAPSSGLPSVSPRPSPPATAYPATPVNVTASTPPVNVTTSMPPVNVTASMPPLNVTASMPPLNVTASMPPVNATTPLPSNVTTPKPTSNTSDDDLSGIIDDVDQNGAAQHAMPIFTAAFISLGLLLL